MVVLLSLLAAIGFALGTVLQQKGTLQDSGDGGGAAFLLRLLASPVWLLGGAVTALAGLVQAVALHSGSLAVVQAIATLSLVIALPFGVWLTDQRLTREVWVGAGVMVVGVVLFVVFGSPQAGTGSPSAESWWTAGLASAALIALLAWAGRNRAPGRQAVLYGAAAGLGFGLATALLKSVTNQFAHGLTAVLTGWQVWAMVVAAAAGLFLGQSALRTGSLAPAMASTNSVNLVSSVWLGAAVFDERLQRGDGRLVLVGVGLALALAGVALLSGAPAAPAPTEPVPSPA